MKRARDEGKIMGPMFPRLHVHDADKGGPRAPPRNKMALYEQLSIPSQRFSPGVVPLNPNNTTNLVPHTSSSHGNGHERDTLFSLQRPHSINPSEKPYACCSELSTPLSQLQQKKKPDEDDIQVHIFFHSGKRQENSKGYYKMDKEKLSTFSPAYSGHSMKLQNATDEEPKCTSITGLKFRQDDENQSEENSIEFVAGREQAVKSSSKLLSTENAEGPLKQTNASPIYEHSDHPADNFNILLRTNESLHLQMENRAKSQPDSILHGDGVSTAPIRVTDHGNSLTPLTDFQSEELRSHNDPIDDNGSSEGKTCRSLQAGNIDKSDDVSETSMVDSISALGIFPDDVVGIIGRKHFWKARRAIVNQQRVFTDQLFELHRLIKVQSLIARSPHLLVEEYAYLSKPLNGSPMKKLTLDYIVKAPPSIAKYKDESEKPNHSLECSAENVVGKTSVSSVKNGIQPSNYRPFSENPLPIDVTTETKMGRPCFHQPAGYQWLVPVMSPSEGLVYKQYPGPGFVGPACGGCGPPASMPTMDNFLSPAYWFSAYQHHYQGIGVPPLPPSAGHGYFPPCGMGVMNPAISGSAVKQMNNFAAPTLHHRVSGGEANFTLQHQSSCNMPSQKHGATSNIVKLRASEGSELQGSTASSPSDTGQGKKIGRTVDGRNSLPFFPTSPAVSVSEGTLQLNKADHPAQVIKVVPRNARSATESAARIFQSIQEERRQHDSV